MRAHAFLGVLCCGYFGGQGVARSDEPAKPALESRVKDFDRVVYSFRDASVPPKFHRSYTVTLTRTKGTIRIYDYTQTLLKEDFSVSPERWQELRDAAAKLTDEGERLARGATGTKAHTIELYRAEELSYRFVWDSLSAAKDTTTAFMELVKASVKPGLDKLVEKTRKD